MPRRLTINIHETMFTVFIYIRHYTLLDVVINVPLFIRRPVGRHLEVQIPAQRAVLEIC